MMKKDNIKKQRAKAINLKLLYFLIVIILITLFTTIYKVREVYNLKININKTQNSSLKLEKAISYTYKCKNVKEAYLLSGKDEYFILFQKSADSLFNTIEDISKLDFFKEEYKAKSVVLINKIKQILRLWQKDISENKIKIVNNEKASNILNLNEIHLIKNIQFNYNELKQNQITFLKRNQSNFIKQTYILIVFVILNILISLFLIIYIIQSLKKEFNLRKKLFDELKNKSEKFIFNSAKNSLDKTPQVVIKNIMTEIQKTISFVKEIANGNYSVKYEGLTGENRKLNKNNLVGELLSMQDLFVEKTKEEENRKDEDKKRNWANQGVAIFGDILRQNNNNLEQLTNRILKQMVNYLNANQGALFLYNNENKDDIYFDLLAAYAYDRRKYLSKRINQGEGLIGASAIEKETILLSEIPEEYAEITSGLGSAIPRNIVIIPLKLENEVLGVIEIASFYEFKPHEVEFAEKIAENIAATITTTKINSQTAKLLEQSRLQADEMAAQEEEMRQNLEELQATQEEAARKAAELKGTIDAINAMFASADYDTSGTILEANSIFVKKLELSQETIIGKKHHNLIFEEDINSEDYLNFWGNLKEGKTQHCERKYKTSKGEKIWFKEVYTPLLDAHGNINKILGISIDVTEERNQQKELEEVHENLEQQKAELEDQNNKMQKNEMILKNALTSAREKESQIKDQNDQMAAQEEEMLQNLEMLQKAQDEMIKHQTEVEDANKRMKENEEIMKKSILKSKDKERKNKVREKDLNEKFSKTLTENKQLNLLLEKYNQQENKITQLNSCLELANDILDEGFFAIQIPTLKLDDNTKIIWSEKAEYLANTTFDNDIIDWNFWSEKLKKENKDSFILNLNNYIENNQNKIIYNQLFEIENKNKNYTQIELNAKAIRNSDGKAICIAGFIKKIS